MALADFDLVLFGGGGDLSMRKLLPAMYARHRAKDLPPNARVICVGRHEWSQEEFIAAVNENSKPHISQQTFDATLWQQFCERITYVVLNASDVSTYPALVSAMRDDANLTRVYYLCLLYTSPSPRDS